MENVVVLVLLFCIKCVTSQVEISQTPLNLQVAAREEGRITCQYKTSIFSNLQWYKQLSNARPEHVLTSVMDGNLTKNNIKVSLNKSEQFSVMSILNSEIQDSATYFCAVNADGGYKLIFGNGTRLIIEPKHYSKPSAYILKSNKDGKAKACLVDTLSSTNLTVELSGEKAEIDPSIVDTERLFSVVAIPKESNDVLNCIIKYKNESDDIVYDAAIDEEINICNGDINTDENLNTLTLAVLAVRIIFFKSIVFNVLMTARAWMS